jgi:hypothetical protein
MQKKFAGRVAFILVYRETGTQLREFFKQHRRIKLPYVPVITSAGWLFELLPLNSLQANVWIDAGGMVRYVTMDYSVTAGRIEAFLAGHAVDVTNIEAPTREAEKPMIDFKPGTLAAYSYVGHCKEGLNIGNGIWKDSQQVRLACNCMSITELCKRAFEERGRYRFVVPASIEIQLPDSLRFVRPRNEEQMDQWMRKYCFNYELMVPLDQEAMLYEMMQEDMRRYFGVEVRVLQKKVPSLVLVRTMKEDKLKTKGGLAMYQLYASTDYHSMQDSARYLTNEPFEMLSRILKGWVEHALGYPFFNETGYEGRIDIEMGGEVVDHISLAGLKKALKPYGLDLVEKERIIDVLMICKKKGE